MKLNKHNLILPVLAAGMLVGCNSPKQVITSTPTPCVLTPDSQGKAHLDVMFNIPDHYVSSRSRLFITPALSVGDSILDQYEPIVLDASIYSKKTLRKEVLHGYVDPWADRVVKLANGSQTVPYNDYIAIPEDVDAGRVVAIISNDGCGQCSGIDTIDVAVVSIPVNLIDEDMQTIWIEPEFVVRPKIHQGKGEARLQFIVNKSNIVMDLANNREELSGMLETLQPILQDSLATLNSLNIFGSASAEGSYKNNIALANNRANAAKDWLSQQLELPRSVRGLIHVGAAPEGWEPVVQAMIAANDPDSIKVRELMIKYPGPTDDAAEKYIRKLACWPRILEKYLAKDRKVRYDYGWTIKSFTNDKELTEMYRTRPDAFNEDELLRVATLAEDDNARKEVYETLLSYFPDSKVGASNLAVLYLKEGNVDAARKLLAGREDYTPEMLTSLAVCYASDGEYDRAAEILQDIDLPAARYNLGLIKAKQRKLNESYELLRPFADTNSAISALSINKLDEAKKIMDASTDTTPRAEYVRAMIAARLGDKAAAQLHLRNASSDETLRKRSLIEPEFDGLQNN